VSLQGILRGVGWREVLGGSALGATVLAVCVAVPTGGPPLTYVRLALIALAGATAFVLDEPGAAAVAAAPVTRARRTAVRLLAVLLPLGIWASGVLALAVRHPATPVGALVTEGVGVLALALAGAAGLRLAGSDEPGEMVASVLGATLLAVLLFGSPSGWPPPFPVDGGWATSTLLWIGLAAGAIVVVVVASGDLVSRPHARRRRSGLSAGRRAAPGGQPAAFRPGTGAAVGSERHRP
jgi:hypothetical protein